MPETTFEYLNKLAEQVILISSLLGGFSIAVIANFLISKSTDRLSKWILLVATLAASFFLVAVFSMTKLLLMTTPGYPVVELNMDMLFFPRIVGFLAFFVGTLSLFVMIALSGWTKSKRLGIITTIIGAVALLFALVMTS